MASSPFETTRSRRCGKGTRAGAAALPGNVGGDRQRDEDRRRSLEERQVGPGDRHLQRVDSADAAETRAQQDQPNDCSHPSRQSDRKRSLNAVLSADITSCGKQRDFVDRTLFWQPARVLSARSAGARRLLFSRRFVETEEVLSLPMCSLQIKRSRLAALLHWFSASTRHKRRTRP